LTGDACRQNLRSRPSLGSGREEGLCANVFGQSRNDFTSNIRARRDKQKLPFRFVLTFGEASDYPAAEPLSAIPVVKPAALLTNKGYGGDRFLESLPVLGILLIIPSRSIRKVPNASTIGPTGTPTASSGCLASADSNAASQPAMKNLSSRSTATSTSPLHA